MANDTVKAVIKLRTTTPTDNKLEKGEVYIYSYKQPNTEDGIHYIKIYIGSNDSKDQNVIDTNIKPTTLRLVNDHYEPEYFGGFVGNPDGFSSPQGVTKSINDVQINQLTINDLSQMVIDTDSGDICGPETPTKPGTPGQIYFQLG